MTSRHSVVQTLPLICECIWDEMDGVKIYHGTPISAEEIYVHRAMMVPSQVDTWHSVRTALSIDLNNLLLAFAITSNAFSKYVREFGTGTHGGKSGLHQYSAPNLQPISKLTIFLSAALSAGY